MLVYKLEETMDKIPDNCNDCKCHWCRLPIKSNRGGYTDEIKKEFMTKRHKKCPLIEL